MDFTKEMIVDQYDNAIFNSTEFERGQYSEYSIYLRTIFFAYTKELWGSEALLAFDKNFPGLSSFKYFAIKVTLTVFSVLPLAVFQLEKITSIKISE